MGFDLRRWNRRYFIRLKNRARASRVHPSQITSRPSRLPSARTRVERAGFLASRWSAPLYERPGRQEPRLLGLSRVDGRPDGRIPRPPHKRAVAGGAWSISEPERPRRRHRRGPRSVQSRLMPPASPLVGARGAGRAERGGDRSDGAARRRTRARRSGSEAGCLELVEKVVTQSRVAGVSRPECCRRCCGFLVSRPWPVVGRHTKAPAAAVEAAGGRGLWVYGSGVGGCGLVCRGEGGS